MLTLFACPKPFKDPHIRTIQRNAIRSWLELRPRPEIILLGDEAGTAEFSSHHVARSEFGTPLVSDLFHQAELAATQPLLAYVNADIILMQDFVDAAAALPAHPFLMVGRRWDLDVTEPLEA